MLINRLKIPPGDLDQVRHRVPAIFHVSDSKKMNVDW